VFAWLARTELPFVMLRWPKHLAPDSNPLLPVGNCFDQRSMTFFFINVAAKPDVLWCIVSDCYVSCHAPRRPIPVLS
jgi:hypothetical protein